MGVDQISKFRPNFTISAKFHNPGILGIPGVRAVSQFLQCFLYSLCIVGQVHDSNTSTERWMEDLTRSWMPPLLVSRQLGGTPRSSSTVSPLILFRSATFYTWCTKPVFNQKNREKVHLRSLVLNGRGLFCFLSSSSSTLGFSSSIPQTWSAWSPWNCSVVDLPVVDKMIWNIWLILMEGNINGYY